MVFISQSDELTFPVGGVKVAYPFHLNGDSIAVLRLDHSHSNRGYCEIADRCFQLLACKGTTVLSRGSIQVNVGGLNIIEMKVKWLGNRGEIISRWGHRYTFKVVKRPVRQVIVEHDASQQIVLSFSPRDKVGYRRIKVGNVVIDELLLDQDEIIGLILAISFYIIRIDISENIATISVSGSG